MFNLKISFCLWYYVGGGRSPGLRIEDCCFSECDLSGADFSSANLVWSDAPTKDHYGIIDYDQNGQPIFSQITRGPFSGADKAAVNFENVIFENADFRDAEHIDKAIFLNAKGLDTCVFDNDEIIE